MGAWGVGNFDNDTALDWIHELEKYDDLTFIEETLDSIDEDYIETDDGEKALIVIEAIASLKGNFSKSSYSEDLNKWVETHPLKVSNSLLERAKFLLDIIISDNSELKELWEETNQFDEWSKEIHLLAQRIEYEIVIQKKNKVNIKSLFIDDKIIDSLIKWADENNIPDLYKKDHSMKGFPRDRKSIAKLKSLKLENLELNSIPEEIYELKSLETLYFENCALQEISDGIAKLTKLKYLSLEENNLSSIPENLEKLQKLTILVLSENNFETVPSVVFNLKALTSLFIDNMNLKHLSKEIKKLTNLKTLFLNNNPLKELPIEIGNLINLKEFVAYGCELEYIPHSIGSLVKLKELELEENSLKTLPKELGGLKKLSFCSAHDNPISSLPKECKWLVEKEKLELSETDIQYY